MTFFDIPSVRIRDKGEKAVKAETRKDGTPVLDEATGFPAQPGTPGRPAWHKDSFIRIKGAIGVGDYQIADAKRQEEGVFEPAVWPAVIIEGFEGPDFAASRESKETMAWPDDVYDRMAVLAKLPLQTLTVINNLIAEVTNTPLGVTAPSDDA